MYKFRSISRGEHKRSYYHPVFKRGNWEAVKRLTRDAMPRKQQFKQQQQIQQLILSMPELSLALVNFRNNQQHAQHDVFTASMSGDSGAYPQPSPVLGAASLPVGAVPLTAPGRHQDQPHAQQAMPQVAPLMLPRIHHAPAFQQQLPDMGLLDRFNGQLHPLSQVVVPTMNTYHVPVRDSAPIMQASGMCPPEKVESNAKKCYGVVKINSSNDLRDGDHHFSTDFMSKGSLMTVDPVDTALLQLLDVSEPPQRRFPLAQQRQSVCPAAPTVTKRPRSFSGDAVQLLREECGVEHQNKKMAKPVPFCNPHADDGEFDFYAALDCCCGFDDDHELDDFLQLCAEL